ncbi:Pycsar system effector family protein [Saccharopolyspora sp. NPDC000995]
MVNIEDAWKALQQTTDLIKAADTKAGAVLAASGVLGGVLVRALPAPQDWTTRGLYTGSLLVSLGLVSVSILLALWVFVPRLNADESRSPLFFDNAASWYSTSNAFTSAYRDLLEDAERLQLSLCQQVWATSRVAQRKFRAVTPAIWTFGASLIVALGAGLARLG